MKTPTLDFSQMHELMSDAQEMFDIEFDPWEEPRLEFSDDETWPREIASDGSSLLMTWRVDLDEPELAPPPALRMAQAFTVLLRGSDLHARRETAARAVAQVVELNPHGTFQIVCEPTGDARCVTPELIDKLLAAAFETTSYLDRFYAVMPGRPKGAKRVLVVVPADERERLGRVWADEIGQLATIVWQGSTGLPLADLDVYETVVTV